MPVRKIIPPLEIQNIGDKPFVKVFILHELHNSGKATKYALRVTQVINNCKVTAQNQDVWIPNHLFHASTIFNPTNKYIWIEKSHYDKMRFV